MQWWLMKVRDCRQDYAGPRTERKQQRSWSELNVLAPMPVDIATMFRNLHRRQHSHLIIESTWLGVFSCRASQWDQKRMRSHVALVNGTKKGCAPIGDRTHDLGVGR